MPQGQFLFFLSNIGEKEELKTELLSSNLQLEESFIFENFLTYKNFGETLTPKELSLRHFKHAQCFGRCLGQVDTCNEKSALRDYIRDFQIDSHNISKWNSNGESLYREPTGAGVFIFDMIFVSDASFWMGIRIVSNF